jgi:peptidoglycan-N-acetylglucosamine deacetylase
MGLERSAAVVLTFDDGPGPSTARLLDVLAERGVRAAFFLLGCNIEKMVECAVTIARAGHVLGNHGYSHARPEALDPRAFLEEIEQTDRLLERVAQDAGVPLARPSPVRLPYGPHSNDPRLPVLAALGRPHVHWTACFEDWLNPEPAELAERMRAHVETQRSTGRSAVLDLHDSSRSAARRDATVEAVDLLLRDRSQRVVASESALREALRAGAQHVGHGHGY